ncbi:Histone-Lysine N-Methyltransferase Setd2 [Manis pentadactyla]|nr:Histone-Lysine N-Methyltransferase Setd2 [Manis pentadactyla]
MGSSTTPSTRPPKENEAKIENVQKTGFIKGPVFKGVASSQFLPEGTKTKVNLEEQGRQKVSFSFSLTKKTLQNRFLTALGNDKQNDPSNSPAVLQVDLTPKIKMDIGDTLSTTEESSPPKSRVQLGKIHFKKHFLHKDKGSMQAPEISSNSIKDSLAVNEKKDLSRNLEKTDMKDRGPLKKRRQELESDSEIDGELQDRKKERVELEQGETAVTPGTTLVGPSCVMEDFRDPQQWKECAKHRKMPCYFDLIEENVYLTKRKNNKFHRDIKQMQGECTPLSKDEIAQGEIACG